MAPAATAAEIAPTTAPIACPLSPSNPLGPIAIAMVVPTKNSTPPANASSNRIEGRAIRRRAVKNNASPHAVAATNRPVTGDGPRSKRSPIAAPMLYPIQPTAKSRIAAAIDTKMSLKPVSRRNCSSSTAGRAPRPSRCARNANAASAGNAPAATASSISAWLYMDRVPPELAHVCPDCVAKSIQRRERARLTHGLHAPHPGPRCATSMP